jgi:hypothetical protein
VECSVAVVAQVEPVVVEVAAAKVATQVLLLVDEVVVVSVQVVMAISNNLVVGFELYNLAQVATID